MSPTKLITVIGATGNQGGSVVDTFLAAPGWRVRGITRNASSAKAKALAARGAEVVEADMDDPSTLPPVFAGSQAIFAVSDFWGLYGDPANKDKPAPGQPLNEWAAAHETEQLKSVIDAAAAVPALERFILSSLSDATKWSRGKYPHVFHFDSKAKAEAYGREGHPDLWAKTSVFQAGIFLSNFVSHPLMSFEKNADGVVRVIGDLDVDVKHPMIAAEEDSGPIVKAMVESPPGKSVVGQREWMSLQGLVQAFTAVTGMEAEAIKTPEGQSKFSHAGDLRQELEDNMAYFNEIGYTGGDPDVIDPQELSNPPKLPTVEDYFRKQDWAKVLGQ